MRKFASLIFAISATAFIFSGCKDRNASMLSEPGLSAADTDQADDPLHLEGVLKIRTRTGDGPYVIKYLDPVTWDGVSPIQPGVFYKFKNLEEAKKATADDPQAQEVFDQLAGEDLGGLKTKDSEPELAYEGYWVGNAYAAVLPGGGGTYKIQCLTHTENPFGVIGLITHYSAFWVNRVETGYYTDYFSDQLNHETDYSLWRGCPVMMLCSAKVYHWSEGMAGMYSDELECEE